MQKETRKNLFTIPNLLSCFRLLLIPVFFWMLQVLNMNRGAAAILLVSGFTDILDGFIARRFNMESNLGKVLDPIADKLTQAAMCLALIARYPIMLWVLIFFGVKELALAVLGSHYMMRTGIVNSARWYGKASSIVQFVVMPILIFNPDISDYSSGILIAMCQVTHALSLLLYVIFYIRSMRHPHETPGVAMRPIDWQVMGMYLMLLLALFVLMFTTGETFLHDVLPRPLYLFLRFASIVGVMGVPAFFIGEKLPRSWFRSDAFPYASFSWEREGKIYEKIGIQWWKTHFPDMSKYLRRAFAKQGNLSRDPQHLRRLIAETCSAEFVHWALILLSPVFLILMEEFGWLAMIIYIIGNLVPIVIQRYNRPRIIKIVQRIEKRKCADC